jgi:hypothetical protein
MNALNSLHYVIVLLASAGSAHRSAPMRSIDGVEISGTSTEFTRTADSGRHVRMHFCPACGSTVYWKADASPRLIGLAVGSFAEPSFPPPAMSVFEQAKHSWVRLDETVESFHGLPGGQS